MKRVLKKFWEQQGYLPLINGITIGILLPIDDPGLLEHIAYLVVVLGMAVYCYGLYKEV